MQEELWKDIEGFEGRYQVSNMGRVKALALKHKSFGMDRYITRKEHIRKTYLRLGYCRVILWINGKPKAMDVHRLVATAFILNPENKPFINHKNGIKTDNRAENLEWCTRSENVQHAYKTGLINPNNLGKCKGEKHGCHKLTNEEVLYIRKNAIKRDKKFGLKALSQKFNVSSVVVGNIVNGKLWKCLLDSEDKNA